MKLSGEAKLLRIFVGEASRHEGEPVYDLIVEEAKKRGLAGATVLRGTVGFGANSRLHTAKILRLSEDLPMVVEIVDEADKIDGFMPFLDEVLEEGLVTQEKVEVVHYRHNKGGEG